MGKKGTGTRRVWSAGAADKALPEGPWVLVLLIILVAIILGQYFFEERPDLPIRSKAKRHQKAKSKASPKGGVSSPIGAVSHVGNMVETASLLGKLSDQVSQLVAANELTEKSANEYLEMLELLLSEVKGDDETSQQLRSAAAVVKAQLLAAAKGMKDSDVEKEFNVSGFSSPRYWEDHYRKQSSQSYDWYVNWDTELGDSSGTLGSFLTRLLKPSYSVLVMGCGNSPLSADLYRAGFENILNIDISATVIEQMKARYGKELPKMSWEVRDAATLGQDGQVFDMVLDKGTLDAVSTDEEVSRGILAGVANALTQTEHGTFVSIGSKSLEPLTKEGAGIWAAEAGFACEAKRIDKSSRSAPSYLHLCRRAAGA